MSRIFIFVSFLIHIVKPQNAHQISDANGIITTVFIRDANGAILGQPTQKKDDFGRPLPMQPGNVCSSLNTRTCDFLQGDVLKVTRSPRPLTRNWLKNLEVGDRVDALDYTNHWFTAEIVQKKRENGKATYKIHFDGWEDKWDEWIAWDSGRLNKEQAKARGGRAKGGVSGVKYLASNLPETYKDKIPPQKKPQKTNLLENLTKKKPTTSSTKNKKDSNTGNSKKKTSTISSSTTTTTRKKSTVTTTTTTRKVNNSKNDKDKKSNRKWLKPLNSKEKKEKEFVSKDMEKFLNLLAVG